MELGLSYIACGIFMVVWALGAKISIAPRWAWAIGGAIVWWGPYLMFTNFGEGMGLVGGIVGQIIAGIIVVRKSVTKEHKTARYSFERIEERTKQFRKK